MNYNNTNKENFNCLYCGEKLRTNNFDIKTICFTCNVNYEFSIHNEKLYSIHKIFECFNLYIYPTYDEINFITGLNSYYTLNLKDVPNINMTNAEYYFEQVLKLEILK